MNIKQTSPPSNDDLQKMSMRMPFLDFLFFKSNGITNLDKILDNLRDNSYYVEKPEKLIRRFHRHIVSSNNGRQIWRHIVSHIALGSEKTKYFDISDVQRFIMSLNEMDSLNVSGTARELEDAFEQFFEAILSFDRIWEKKVYFNFVIGKYNLHEEQFTVDKSSGSVYEYIKSNIDFDENTNTYHFNSLSERLTDEHIRTVLNIPDDQPVPY